MTGLSFEPLPFTLALSVWGYHYASAEGPRERRNPVAPLCEYGEAPGAGWWDRDAAYLDSVRVDGGPPPEWWALPAVVELVVLGGGR